MDVFTSQGISELTSLEQILISGVDENGDKINPSKMIDMIDTMLQKQLKHSEKLRLTLLTMICMAVTEKDRDKIVRHLNA